jgi:AGZA family xanthine/uracil permease-like MFS transporter
MIGIFMMQGLADLDLKNIVIASTALVTLLLMTLTSVSDGLALGFVVQVVVLWATGMRRSIKPMGWALAGVFVIHYIVR